MTEKIKHLTIKKIKRNIHGVLLLDKPQGVSSNHILQRVKRLFRANKAGHTGALDPLATGMLPICLGEATKFSHFLLDADKRYVVTAKLGERTDTSDAEGQIVQTQPITCKQADILSALPHFTGALMQVPTMFSALKHQGKPLYEYARAGMTIERQARPITIFELIFQDYHPPFLTLEVHCSKGTYIRTLIDDLGEYLGCGAHVTMLRRIGVAHYPTQDMLTWEQLQQMAQTNEARLDQLLLPIDTAVEQLPTCYLTQEQVHSILFGRRIRLTNEQIYFSYDQPLRLFNQSTQQFLGIGTLDPHHVLHPQRLLNFDVM